MKSLLRFLVFVALVAMVVGALWLYFGRGFRPAQAVQAEAPLPVLPVPEASATPPVRVETRTQGLVALDGELTGLIEHVLPSVVSISAVPPNTVDPRLQALLRSLGHQVPGAQPDLGSGVIVSKEGHIVTNLHVIQRSGAVFVHLNDGRSLPAEFVGADPRSDIAILRIKGEGLQPLVLGDSDRVKVGQMVFAVGNPLGLQETVTQGIISAKGRRAASEAANEFFQTDAAINPGNSGGPLINLQGEVVAINNAILPQGEGIGFAIPSNTVRRVFESIRDNGRFVRPWFGAYSKPLNPRLARQLGETQTQGAVVILTYEGSPAKQAGLQPGDIIVAFNGRPIRDHMDLRNRVAEAAIGQKVDLAVRRKGRDLQLQAVIAPEPEA